MSNLIEQNHKDTLSIIHEQKEASKAGDKKLQENIESIMVEFNILKNGILSIQSRQFKKDCRTLLEPEHVITLQEYENISNEHHVYNSLHGNHEGDQLFELVHLKYTNQSM